MTRQDAIEKLHQYFVQNRLNNGGTEKYKGNPIMEDVLDELDEWFDNDPPNMVGEFVIDILTKEN